MAPRCQQEEGPAPRFGLSGPLGKEGVPTASPWRNEGRPRVPSGEELGAGVDSDCVGKNVGRAWVVDGWLTVLTPVGYPGAPEGGLCPGDRAGRPASGRSRDILAGYCRGCRMADGARTAFGRAEMEAQGFLKEAAGAGSGVREA